MKKRLIAATLMFAVFLTSAFAATAYQKSITVDYNINLEINGGTPVLTDANGKTVQPFTYEGTTYVPIRAVAEEMGAYVGYDSASKTAIVFQDDVEAMSLAHSISELSHTLSDTVMNLFSICQLVNEGQMSPSDALLDAQQLANIADSAYEEMYSEYSLAQENNNIYLSSINECINAIYEEYVSAAAVAGYAAEFFTSKNVNLLQSIADERATHFIEETASDLATDFIDSMW